MEEFADGADDGFIIFTLGSNADTAFMPQKIKEAFIRAFSRLKQRVFWKWQKDDIDMNRLPRNLKIVEWMPQQDLLG